MVYDRNNYDDEEIYPSSTGAISSPTVSAAQLQDRSTPTTLLRMTSAAERAEEFIDDIFVGIEKEIFGGGNKAGGGNQTNEEQVETLMKLYPDDDFSCSVQSSYGQSNTLLYGCHTASTDDTCTSNEDVDDISDWSPLHPIVSDDESDVFEEKEHVKSEYEADQNANESGQIIPKALHTHKKGLLIAVQTSETGIEIQQDKEDEEQTHTTQERTTSFIHISQDGLCIEIQPSFNDDDDVDDNYKEKNGNKNSSGNRDVCEGCFHPDADFDDMNEKEKNSNDSSNNLFDESEKVHCKTEIKDGNSEGKETNLVKHHDSFFVRLVETNTDGIISDNAEGSAKRNENHEEGTQEGITKIKEKTRKPDPPSYRCTRNGSEIVGNHIARTDPPASNMRRAQETFACVASDCNDNVSESITHTKDLDDNTQHSVSTDELLSLAKKNPPYSTNVMNIADVSNNHLKSSMVLHNIREEKKLRCGSFADGDEDRNSIVDRPARSSGIDYETMKVQGPSLQSMVAHDNNREEATTLPCAVAGKKRIHQEKKKNYGKTEEIDTDKVCLYEACEKNKASGVVNDEEKAHARDEKILGGDDVPSSIRTTFEAGIEVLNTDSESNTRNCNKEVTVASQATSRQLIDSSVASFDVLERTQAKSTIATKNFVKDRINETIELKMNGSVHSPSLSFPAFDKKALDTESMTIDPDVKDFEKALITDDGLFILQERFDNAIVDVNQAYLMSTSLLNKRKDHHATNITTGAERKNRSDASYTDDFDDSTTITTKATGMDNARVIIEVASDNESKTDVNNKKLENKAQFFKRIKKRLSKFSSSSRRDNPRRNYYESCWHEYEDSVTGKMYYSNGQRTQWKRPRNQLVLPYSPTNVLNEE